MNKRQRGRGRKHNNNNNNNNPNRSLDSNGPDVKIRGSANTIYDKYTTLARDAASSGSRVKAENYLQHAEHYLRLVMEQQAKAAAHAEQQAAQQAARQQQNNANANTDGEQSDDDGQNKSNGRGRRYPARRRQLDQNQAKTENTNGEPPKEEAVKAPKDKGDTAEAATPDAEAKPKKTRRKKPVEAVAEAPPEESVSSAAE